MKTENTPNQPESDQSERDLLAQCRSLLDRTEQLTRRDAESVLGILRIVRALAIDLLESEPSAAARARAEKAGEFADRTLRSLGDVQPRH